MVILSNCVFVHVPKTGGTSVAKVLGGTYRPSKFPQHVPYRCIESIGKPGFGFIRNPWDRMVSLYYFLLKSPTRHLPRVDPQHLREIGFKRWLLEEETFMSNEPVDGTICLRGYQGYKKGSYKGIDKLPHKALGLPGLQRRPSMWFLDGCKFIGRTENLQEDFNRAMSKFGQPRRQVVTVNVTRHRPKKATDWRKLFDNEMIEHVYKYFAWDMEVGGYQW